MAPYSLVLSAAKSRAFVNAAAFMRDRGIAFASAAARANSAGVLMAATALPFAPALAFLGAMDLRKMEAREVARSESRIQKIHYKD